MDVIYTNTDAEHDRLVANLQESQAIKQRYRQLKNTRKSPTTTTEDRIEATLEAYLLEARYSEINPLSTPLEVLV